LNDRLKFDNAQQGFEQQWLALTPQSQACSARRNISVVGLGTSLPDPKKMFWRAFGELQMQGAKGSALATTTKSEAQSTRKSRLSY
jgi:hypothetical protein